MFLCTFIRKVRFFLISKYQLLWLEINFKSENISYRYMHVLRLFLQKPFWKILFQKLVLQSRKKIKTYFIFLGKSEQVLRNIYEHWKRGGVKNEHVISKNKQILRTFKIPYIHEKIILNECYLGIEICLNQVWRRCDQKGYSWRKIIMYTK